MKQLLALDKYLACLLMISFFLPPIVQVVAVISVCSFFAIRDLLFIRREAKSPTPVATVLLLSSLYLLNLVWLPFTPDAFRPALYFVLSQKVSLLLLPIAFFLMSNGTRQVIMSALPAFVLACLTSCIIGNASYLLNRSHLTGDGPAHVYYRIHFETITNIHPTYMGMFLTFSIAIVLFMPLVRLWQSKISKTLFLIVLFAFLLALMPKAPFASMVFILLLFIWSIRKNLREILPLAAAGVAGLLAVLAIAPFSLQRIMEVRDSVKHIGSTNPVKNSINMRKLILDVDITLLKQYWLTGTGPGEIESKLNNQYFAFSAMMKTPLKFYNTHNEYLHTWISYGLPGMLFLMAILAIQWNAAIRRYDSLHVALLLILCVTFFTENVLARQQGVLFYSVFTALFLLQSSVAQKQEIIPADA